MFFLQARMMFLVAMLFAVVYAMIAMAGAYLGVANFAFYAVVALFIMIIQYAASPKLVEWTMRVRYVNKSQYPRLFEMVQRLAMNAEIPVPRIGIAAIGIPNAFAFGRSVRDARVCVTENLLELLSDEELRAVLGHEISHIKNRDMVTIALLSVIPMIMYWIYLRFAWGGYRRSSRESGAVWIGMAAFIFYLVSNLLVLYGSRIREYFADRGAVKLGNSPSSLASALYKLVYGAARTDRESLQQVEGLKAFFASDPSAAAREIRELKALDRDRSGSIEPSELAALRSKEVTVSFGERILELYSTHPNMLKRIKQLSSYSA